MDYAFGCGYSRLGEIYVEEFDCVGEDEMLGDGINDMEASIALERRANVESLAAAELPC